MLAKKGKTKDEKGESGFILDDLNEVMAHIEQSTMGTASQDDCAWHALHLSG